MTLAEFLVEFVRVAPRGRWHLDAAGLIRCDGQCPITFVHGQRTGGRLGASWVMCSVDALGLTDAHRIIAAADNKGWGLGLRRTLLAACGLAETP